MTPYRIVLDIQTTQSRQFGERGIPRYTSDFCRALLKAGAPVAALAMNPSLPQPKRLHPDLARAPQLCWNTSRTMRRLRADGPLLYHVMSPLEGPRPVQSALPPHMLGGGTPLVCTIYDLIPEIFKVFPKGSSFERLYLLRRDMMRRADLLLAISASTRRDAIEQFELDPQRVVNIGTGASDFFHPPLPAEANLLEQHLPEITRPFVHAVTGVFGLDKRKNTEGLLEAFAVLPADVRAAYQVVVTCRLTEVDRALWLELARQLGFADGQLVLTDFVPDAVLRALYQRASLFVYPSTYEGFGLPALEAARCGCPTITSNTSAMPEILDWAPSTFSPTDRDDLAGVMEKALVDEGFRAKLRERGRWAAQRHTWERVADRAVDAYATLDPPRAVPVVRSRPDLLRVALVGPLPPTRSGAAVYNARLAAALDSRFELDCIAEGDRERPPSGSRRYRIFPADAMGRVVSAASYDAIFYSLSNGRFHDETYEMALHYPGIVWLHDVHLADLFLSYALARWESEPAREFMLNTLRHHYRERAPEDIIESKDWTDHNVYERAGGRLSAELARRSRGAIVGSKLAEQILRLDAGPYATLPPTWIVPLAIPPAPDWAGSAPAAGDERLVLTIGPVVPDRRPDALLEATAALPGTKLAFVGELAAGHRKRLSRKIASMGVDDRVELTGWVSAAEYQSWMRRATVVVQLRTDTSGASSVAVTDALAHGIPTITSHGAFADVPAGTLRLVDPDISVVGLTDELAALLSDRAAREHMSAAALSYAKSWTFDDVAARLVEIANANLAP